MKKISPIISAGELATLIGSKELVVIDVRTGPGAREKYDAEHIEGARFADLETELSKKAANASMGGRHPLPPVKEFAALLGKLGVDPSKRVVVYDDKNGANAAARLWWMLRSAGHEQVQVLDGGWRAAKEWALPFTSNSSTIEEAPPYPTNEWQWPLADIEEVASKLQQSSGLVIDVREGYRYRGESEPIDTIAGHIPGAVNIPYIENLDAAGNFLPAAELSAKYKAALEGKNADDVIVHCGSGVTACHTLLAIEQAGMKMPALYVGSWSEWSRNDRPVALGHD
jgi:thiosulfate/3-mercaptopyruvate sulfurtransferase